MRKLTFGLVAALLSACPAPSQTDGGITPAAPAGLLYTPAELVCTVGVSCALVGPANAGGPVSAFSIAPALPTGLSLDAVSGAITGIPTTVSPKGNWLVTGTNTGGSASVLLTITIKDAAPSGISYANDPAVYVKGTAITPNAPTARGGAVDSWSILPSLPAGLSFNTTTGVIAGTPSAVSPSTTYLVTATNGGGFATANVTLTINDVAPTMLTWATNPASYTQGVAITPNVPSNSGGAVTQYQVSPALPAGLVLDPVTGIISGTPTSLTPSASHVMTATNSAGSTTAMLNVAVVAVAPSNLIYANNPANYTQGIAITPNQPMVGGGAVVSWSVTPTLPAGLSLDPTTGIISGTPTTLSASAGYAVMASNTGGTTMGSLTLSVRPPTPVITTPPASVTVPLGTRATFSVSATGTGALTYQWKRGGMVMMGVTTASFSINAAVLANDGDQYSVDVSDSYGNTTTSTVATLTVSPATFTTTGAPTRSRLFHTATLLPNGQVLVTGGFGTVGGLGATNTAERYDPSTGQWTAITSTMSITRQQHSAALLSNGKVLVAGGWNGGATATADVFDPATSTFTPTLNNLSIARRNMASVVLNNGKVLLVGGNDFNPGMGIAGTYTNVDLYDPATSRFTATGSLTIARASPTATLLANGKVLVTGGASPASAEVYDPATGQFTATTGAPAIARNFSSAVLLPSGKVLIAGGYDIAAGDVTGTAELFNPATSSFTATTSPLHDARYFNGTTLLPSGAVLFTGGVTTGNTAVLNTAEFYEPATNSFVRVTASMSEAREGHSATVLNNGKLLLAGGASTTGGTTTLATTAELFW